MHSVTCPRCNKVLKVPKPVSNGRIRCTGCEAIFVASSTPAGAPAAAAHPPAVQQPPEESFRPPPRVQWYYTLADREVGPVRTGNLRNLLRERILGDDTEVWREGMDRWELIRDVPEFQLLEGVVPEGEAQVFEGLDGSPTAGTSPFEDMVAVSRQTHGNTPRPAGAGGYRPPRRPQRSTSVVADPTPYLWGFSICWAYMTIGILLPWISFGPLNMNALKLIQSGFKGNHAFGAIILLAYIGVLAGGWIALGRWLGNRSGLPRILPFSSGAMGILVLFVISGMYAESAISPFDLLAPTFYLGVAAAVAAFVCSLLLSGTTRATPLRAPGAVPQRSAVQRPAAPTARAARRATGRERARLYRGKQKKAPVPPAVIAIVGAALLGIIVLAIVLGHMAGRPPDKKPPPKGSPDTKPSAAAAARTGGGNGPVARPNDGARPVAASRPAHAGGNLPKNDAMIKVNHRIRTDDYGNTTAYGEVRNTHKYPVRQVALRFIVRDADGKEMIAGALCNHVPAWGTAGFSVRLGQLGEDASPTIIATSVPEPEGTVCWQVDTTSVRLDAETVKRAIIINGRVVNPTDTTVADVKLHCDFFWRAGHYHSTVVGKLTKAFRIQPGKSEPYRITLANVLAPAGISDQTILRLVGKAVR